MHFFCKTLWVKQCNVKAFVFASVSLQVVCFFILLRCWHLSVLNFKALRHLLHAIAAFARG
jgi:hypothetical protein